MHKIITILVFFVVTTVVYGQTSLEEKEIKETINTFFKGLHNGDSTVIKSTLHTSIKIQTTSVNKEGKKILKTETKNQLLRTIASKKVSDIYFEKLLSYTIKVDGNLASVWTPYEFYYNGKFSHCGANSFQLFNNNGKWEIIYLVDMRRRSNCKALKK
ncbi:nuclear transport factor 2 family protein [Tenacibaculum sp. E3R01]|uniref:nuclear transport factor 2 family protein n=1 Tax=Tenacibaculum sp. E3R01 TaxID=2267227 RepID=UPI000DE9A089|nr:nuclear transport factor 2 family protein [Tenacibaculum sp. E3R01]RBW59813.1 nuclear transport factor 2 family protein [Tenacibaculum sp. E3R01]